MKDANGANVDFFFLFTSWWFVLPLPPALYNGRNKGIPFAIAGPECDIDGARAGVDGREDGKCGLAGTAGPSATCRGAAGLCAFITPRAHCSLRFARGKMYFLTSSQLHLNCMMHSAPITSGEIIVGWKTVLFLRWPIHTTM